MSYVIGKNCEEVCDSSCVSVCPVECIHGPIYPDKMGNELLDLRVSGEFFNLEKPQMYIDPKTCINCGACKPECPVDAIYRSEYEAELKDDKESVLKNYKFFYKD